MPANHSPLLTAGSRHTTILFVSEMTYYVSGVTFKPILCANC